MSVKNVKISSDVKDLPESAASKVLAKVEEVLVANQNEIKGAIVIILGNDKRAAMSIPDEKELPREQLITILMDAFELATGVAMVKVTPSELMEMAESVVIQGGKKPTIN